MFAGDSCGTNFTEVGINCLHTSQELMNYDEAQRKCQDMGSKVVEFHSGQELNEVRLESYHILPILFSTFELPPPGNILDESKTVLDWTH